VNYHIDYGYKLAQSLSICHEIPLILVTAFRIFVIAAFISSHSQTDSSVSAGMADLLCPRCRVTHSIATFEQAFQTKPMQNDTTPGKANKQNLTKLCEVVRPRQQIVCYQQQPEHTGPFSPTETWSACVRCGVCRL
jgi:hypothetical protein